MHNVTLTMSKEEAEATLKASREAERVARDWLAQIRTNILALEKALGLPRSTYQTLPSDSQAGATYEVVNNGDGTYSCTCPSYHYERGLDASHRCKHIRKALDRPYSWRIM